MIQELNAANEKHPLTVLEMGGDHVSSAAVVVEEAGELIKSALQFTFEGGRCYDMHKEAVQTGAMAIKFLLNAPDPVKDREENQAAGQLEEFYCKRENGLARCRAFCGQDKCKKGGSRG
ncbi:MAG: hypothetical protein ABJH57_11240 [Cyclobacteriaceae bacterium]